MLLSDTNYNLKNCKFKLSLTALKIVRNVNFDHLFIERGVNFILQDHEALKKNSHKESLSRWKLVLNGLKKLFFLAYKFSSKVLRSLFDVQYNNLEHKNALSI